MRRLSDATRNSVKVLLRQRKSVRQTAKALGVSHGYVGDVRVDDKENIRPPKMGRPFKISEKTRSSMVSKYNTGILKTLEHGHNYLKSLKEKPVSNRTIKRIMEEAGCYPGIKQKAPALTEKQKKDRVDWAREHIKWKVEDWKKVMFSDECLFERFSTRGRQYYYSNAEHRQRHTHHFRPKKSGCGGKIQVWGCITYHGVGDLEWVEGNMEKEHYVKVLRQYVKASRDWRGMDPGTFVFQHDNSRVHVAKIVQQYLSKAKIKVLDWPVNSPDISPIERVWGHIDQRLNHFEEPPKDPDELFRRVEDIWNDLPPGFLHELYEELPEKMHCLVKTGGLHARVERGARRGQELGPIRHQ